MCLLPVLLAEENTNCQIARHDVRAVGAGFCQHWRHDASAEGRAPGEFIIPDAARES
ncbi:hypothetical protein Q667_06785 [Marinobacter sp. C1S70]|jgi:hypothetical protein|nr:hypothetical protein Q673_07710 [Marinobacter sp. EN3]ERS82241.1 hypothetical protein Q667_06785 [Marinobacter sp. C1S70]